MTLPPAFVEIAQLGKTYATPDGPAVIVTDFSLDVHQGEFVSLLGHSGCGKTTVLSILMGLNTPTTGGVVIGGREVDGPGTDRGVVFQSATLLPWLTVGDNVRLAVDMGAPRWPPSPPSFAAPRQSRGASLDRGHPPAAGAGRERRTAEAYLEAVGLAGMEDRYPRELSAGMQQRVGVARAFALEPRLLLLDEPFSLLDALTRMELQDTLITLWAETRQTVIMVTHDVDEALLLADRIVMMTNGPAATIGRIFDVPFPRPRRREEMIARPDYFWLRDGILDFLDEQAHGRP